MTWRDAVGHVVAAAAAAWLIMLLFGCGSTVEGLRDVATAANEAGPVVTADRACALNACQAMTTEAEMLTCIRAVQESHKKIERLFALLRRIHCTVDPQAEGCAPSSIVEPFTK